MEQKADEQIDAGMHHQKECFNRVRGVLIMTLYNELFPVKLGESIHTEERCKKAVELYEKVFDDTRLLNTFHYKVDYATHLIMNIFK